MYIGIDPSLTGTGFVVIDDNYNTINYSLISTIRDMYLCPEQRILDIFYSIFKYDFSNIKYVCVEGLSYMSQSTSLYERCGLLYLITTKIFEMEIPFELIPPTSLKKKTTGNGRASKEMMVDVVENTFNQNFNQDDNLCDAYGLARVAKDLYNN